MLCKYCTKIDDMVIWNSRENTQLLILCLKVEFQIEESKRNNTKTAVAVKLTARNSSGKQYGYIATLKESYGFIETADHNKEVFFHFR